MTLTHMFSDYVKITHVHVRDKDVHCVLMISEINVTHNHVMIMLSLRFGKIIKRQDPVQINKVLHCQCETSV